MRTLWDRYRTLDDRNPYLTSGLVTLFFTVLMLVDLVTRPTVESGFEQEGVFGVFLALAQVLPLLFVRKAPLVTLMVIFVAFVAHSTFNYHILWVAQFTTLISMYQVAGTTDDRRSLIAGALTFVVIVVVFGAIREDVDSAVALTLLFAAVWVAGNIVRSRRGRLEIAELTVTELSEDRDLFMREAVRDERARIARDLHDVLGHTLNLVVIQSGVAQRVFASAPDKALDAVKSIESTSRQALSDVDRMLGILRDPDDAGGRSTSLEARPSMSRLGSLVDQLRATGQPIDLTVYGPPATLAPSIDLSVYRVVQEALTNVMTHASGSRARVDVEYSENLLSVTITNDSSGVEKLNDRSGGGRGIVGMRERTALFGGKFQADGTDDGGWRVYATFPIGGPG
ncbi:MAG: sensor histidine kinase [Dehalococcoidia bacterium]|jgi:signal transduction histidine kinase|nr:sensor histidine kinase [Dehalococcoidia bacterium]